MFYQLKPAFSPIQEVPGAGVPWVEVLTRKEVEQRTNTTEIPFLERSLVHSHNCKAELLENCAAGTVLIPRKERHGSEIAFAFWLTGEKLTFVDDSGQGLSHLLGSFFWNSWNFSSRRTRRSFSTWKPSWTSWRT